jgi:crossover junction endodeoxyribonuclease RuvC
LKTDCIRILGVDTSLRSTGVGIVDSMGSRLKAVEYGTIKAPRTLSLSECLHKINSGIAEFIERSKPDAAAIEGVFFSKNVKTTLMLGEARGAVITACAAHGIPVYEYAPRSVKQAVVGVGGAEKDQVAKMVMMLLGLREQPQEDAADALAVAICHLHNRTGCAALMPKPV